MKRIILFCFLGGILLSECNSQVFNTSATLKPRNFSIGVEPGLFISSRTDAYVFLHASAGVLNGVDFGFKFGLGGDQPYIGGDVEVSIGRYFSFSGGAHAWEKFGLDATGLVTFPLRKGVKFYTGLDSDIIFADETKIPIWIPIGIDIAIHKSIYFVFESEINITNDLGHFIGGGLNFIF